MKPHAIWCAIAILPACQLTEKNTPPKKNGPAMLTQKVAPKSQAKKTPATQVSALNTAPKSSDKDEVSTGTDGQKKTVKAVAKKRASVRKKTAVAKWGPEVDWQSWPVGRRRAAETGKPLCLVVYADWCPRCRELTPIFSQPDIAELAKKFIMVKQDQDQRPPWLAEYRDQGSYVPRIFFFGSDGQLRADITSGNGRFPYFYTPRGGAALKASMRRASGG